MTERSAASRYSQRTKRRARTLYAKRGWSKARISRELDVGMGALRRWLADLDETTPSQRRYDRDAILADAATMNRSELQTKHGCSQRFLSDLLTGKLKP